MHAPSSLSRSPRGIHVSSCRAPFRRARVGTLGVSDRYRALRRLQFAGCVTVASGRADRRAVAGSTRDGSIDGTSSFMESLNDGYDFTFIFDTRVDRNGNDFDLTPLTTYLEEHI